MNVDLPASTLAEQSVLGALLQGAALESAGPLSASHFADDANATIFAAIKEQIDEGCPADEVTTLERLRTSGQANRCGGFEYLHALRVGVPSAANMRRYADVVREKALRRELASAADQVRTLALLAPDVGQAFERARELVSAAQPPMPRRYEVHTAEAIKGRPAAEWRIHSVFPTLGLGAIFGPSGTAKSFLGIHFAAAIAEGEDCFGHRTKKGRVIYVALEGQAGLPQRIAAREKDQGREFPSGVRFILQPFSLTDPDDVIHLAAAIDAAGGADVIIVDTYNRATPGSDENSSLDTGRALEALERLQGMTAALVVLVHHTGKDAGKGMRGHSSLHAALDAAVEVTRDGDRREWKVYKAKDGIDGEVHSFRLRQVELALAPDGEMLTSCVVSAEDAADHPTGFRPKPPKGGNQRIVLDALRPLFRDSRTFGRAGAPSSHPCLVMDEAVEAVKGHVPVEPKRQAERTRQAIVGLVATRVLGCNEGWLWLA